MDLSHAERLASKIAKYIGTRRETVRLIVGSIRREEKRVRDIDILIVSPRYSENTLLTMEIHDNPFFSVSRWISRGPRRSSFIASVEWSVILRNEGTPSRLPSEVQVDIFYATQKELPFALLHCTGSKEYLMRMRYIASLRGYKLNQYGMYRIYRNDANNEKNNTDDALRPISRRFRTEGDIQDYLGMKRRHPRDRT